MTEEQKQKLASEYSEWYEDETEYTATTSQIVNWWLAKIEDVIEETRDEYYK